MRNSALVLFITVFCLSVLVVTVEGYDPAYTIAAVAGLTPSIDGTLTAGEWDDASTVSFNDTIAYVKQDGENLYVAFNVSDNTESLSRDGVAVAVDVLNDGGTSTQSDDIIFYISRNGQLQEAQGTNSSGPPTGGWNGSASSTGNYWQAEFNITYAKVQITPGEAKILGTAFMSFDFTLGYPGFWSPMSPSDSGPSHWGNLISEENWIPELSSLFVLSLFMILTVFAVSAKRRNTERGS